MFRFTDWEYGKLTFNRTSMESKPLSALHAFPEILGAFNRTSMESKRECRSSVNIL